MQKRFTSEAAAVNSQGQEFPIIDRLCILPCPPISSTPIEPPLHLSPISPCIRYFLSPRIHGSSVVSGGGDGGGGDGGGGDGDGGDGGGGDGGGGGSVSVIEQIWTYTYILT